MSQRGQVLGHHFVASALWHVLEPAIHFCRIFIARSLYFLSERRWVGPVWVRRLGDHLHRTAPAIAINQLTAPSKKRTNFHPSLTI